MSDQESYWLGVPGSADPPIGPLSPDVIAEGLRTGRVSPDAIVCRVDGAEWVSVMTVIPASATNADQQYMVFVPGSPAPPTGPFNLEQLRTALNAKQIAETAMVSTLGGGPWQPIRVVVGALGGGKRASTGASPGTASPPSPPDRSNQYLAAFIVVVVSVGAVLMYGDRGAIHYRACEKYLTRSQDRELTQSARDENLEYARVACNTAVQVNAFWGSSRKNAEAKLQEIARTAAERKAKAEAEKAQRKAETAVALAKEASERENATAKEDEACKRWVAICTIGHWRDGSPRTTGLNERFSTKAECEKRKGDTGMGVVFPCTACRCLD
jgi:hypothetical protein